MLLPKEKKPEPLVITKRCLREEVHLNIPEGYVLLTTSDDTDPSYIHIILEKVETKKENTERSSRILLD